MTTAAELLLLRTYPQHSEMRMSVFKPTTALACRVNAAGIVKGETIINYDSVTVGSYTNVESGMTMLVGTTLGGSDVGRVRVRSATSGHIKVAKNSDIDWANNLYLTILYFYDVVAVFPRIEIRSNDPENPIFYKDEDILYTNQNTLMGTLICMGPHREVELHSNTGRIFYSSAGTTNVNNESLTYFWEFEGGSPAFYSGSVPGYVNYNTPGNYITKLRVNAASGAVDYGYRYIVVNEEGGGIRDWQLSQLQGSRDSGGYNGSIVINSTLGFDMVKGTPIIISVKTWYGNTQQNIGTYHPSDETFFVGYALENVSKGDYKSQSREFKIGSISEIMKLSNGFAVTMEDVGTDTPTHWYQFKQLNLKKAAYHFWRWHSTVLLTSDVKYVGTDFMQQFFDTNKESIFDAVAGGVRAARLAEVVSDRLGKLWIEIPTRATPNALTAFPPDFATNDDDYINSPTVVEQTTESMAYMEVNGLAYLGPGEGNSIPLIAAAPGDTPMSRGKNTTVTGLALQNQAQLNELAGDLFWNENAQYPHIQMEMRGVYPVLDIAPQTAYTINLTEV